MRIDFTKNTTHTNARARVFIFSEGFCYGEFDAKIVVQGDSHTVCGVRRSENGGTTFGETVNGAQVLLFPCDVTSR